MLIKAAIVAGNYPEVSQTFVRRHVEHLFGGNSVLVCCGQTEYELSARPVYAFCDNGFFILWKSGAIN